MRFPLNQYLSYSVVQCQTYMEFLDAGVPVKDGKYSRKQAVVIYSEVNRGWPVGLLPDTKNRELRMRRECRERFPRLRL